MWGGGEGCGVGLGVGVWGVERGWVWECGMWGTGCGVQGCGVWDGGHWVWGWLWGERCGVEGEGESGVGTWGIGCGVRGVGRDGPIVGGTEMGEKTHGDAQADGDHKGTWGDGTEGCGALGVG